MLGTSKKAKIYPADPRQWVDTERAFGPRPMDADLVGLQNAGVITLVHLSTDGVADEDDRRRFERRGLFYVPISIGGKEINAKLAGEFLELLNARHNCPYYVYDSDGKMAGVATLLFKAIPNFWSFARYKEEATKRGIALDIHPGLEHSIEHYMHRYVRGRR